MVPSDGTTMYAGAQVRDTDAVHSPRVLPQPRSRCLQQTTRVRLQLVERVSTLRAVLARIDGSIADVIQNGWSMVRVVQAGADLPVLKLPPPADADPGIGHICTSEHGPYPSSASRTLWPITKTGNSLARRLLIEAAWHHCAP